MFSRRALIAATRSARTLTRPQPHIPRAQFSAAPCLKAVGEVDDPEMNGGYINPPRVKRQYRDPYADWDDKQERRNFGEPVHEDNEVLGMFALEDYNHMTPSRGLLLWAGFISAILGLSYAVSVTYPGKPSTPKEYPGGLDRELGGSGAVRAFQQGDEIEG
ncbi:NADH dehydrogenase (ubiquinone) 1 beta subcomplex 8 [Capronia epimyces CBS 606.96]|uniref:NADH dehydrogenase (Ubiquinone) 1 beta subcomplex 8 n=1 Tax=Capronia epimyces CBS 606.96 TaxID=1182542 RepID=W9YB23_9EURO|nr:NADH dehydrogenase (ubiquinone) 1 beta subcomplex 8 [Capronia epimyces CBS 606.96]EXJ79574.1 NADH dehydrogenase (ubiquinone) 1 beta subcomplex 8 [Capronia epimyces CBS 606.96]